MVQGSDTTMLKKVIKPVTKNKLTKPMLFIQFTGLSGAGKTSVALAVQAWMSLKRPPLKIEVIDADEYRKTICKDLGFSKEDRIENIRRLGQVAGELTAKGVVAIVAAINPYKVARAELKQQYNAKTVWIKCNLDELIKRDTKGLYKKALMDADKTEKINNLTGINDPYEAPEDADLVINTDLEDLQASAMRLTDFILGQFEM